MTEAEEQDLRSLAADLAGAAKSPWEPRCVALAFATPLLGQPVFTMQTWIDLEAIRSPLLLGEEFTDPQQAESAGRCFGWAIDEQTLKPEEAVAAIEALREAVARAFAMGVKMNPPEGSASRGDGGFGNWLPVFTCLVAECGIQPDAARRLQVGEALALISERRFSQGWEVADSTYAQRDVVAGLSEPDSEEVSNG